MTKSNALYVQSTAYEGIATALTEDLFIVRGAGVVDPLEVTDVDGQHYVVEIRVFEVGE